MKKIVTRFLQILILITLIFPEDKPKIGLVLSGGGIKGFGHLGALYMIDSLNIPIDYVVGTSIGAISSALYATGHSAYEIDKIASETNWEEIFSQTRTRNELFYFQKKDDANFQLTFSLRGVTPTSPISLSNGQYSYEHLLDLFSNYINVESYDNLVIPFRCNATDIITGDEIIFKKGSLSQSLRISTSIPTVFSPIEYNDKLLVDGGLINNLPINIAEDLGAEYIIASNVISKDKSKDEIIDVFNIVQKIINLYGSKNERVNLLKADILVNPESDDIGSIDFNINNIIKLKSNGKKAAYANLNKFLGLKNSSQNFINLASISENMINIDSLILSEDMQGDSLISNLLSLNKTLSKEDITNHLIEIRRSQKYHNIHSKYKKNIDNQSYDMYLHGVKNKPIFINEIEVVGNKKISKEEILNMLSLKNNQELNTKIFNDNIKDIYNTERFEYINYDIVNIDDKNSKLILNIKESENKRLKLGAVWDNHYKLIGKIKLDIFNKPFRNFRLQDELLFSGIKKNKLTLYYLLNHNNKISLIPFIEFVNQIKDIGIFSNDNNTIHYLNHDFKETTLGLIYPISKFGSVSLSYNKFDSKYKGVLNPDSTMENNNIYYTKIKLNIDQIDNLLHPRNGYRINLSYQKSNDIFYTSNDNIQNGYNYLSLTGDYYKTFNYNHTMRLFNQYRKSNDLIPLYLKANYSGSDWSVGYNEFTLTAANLHLMGIEYQYHFKSSITYRLILNKVIKIDTDTESYTKAPINYGIGIKIRSLLGPIDFTWGKGHIIPLDKNSKENNIFYFNFGVEI